MEVGIPAPVIISPAIDFSDRGRFGKLFTVSLFKPPVESKLYNCRSNSSISPMSRPREHIPVREPLGRNGPPFVDPLLLADDPLPEGDRDDYSSDSYVPSRRHRRPASHAPPQMGEAQRTLAAALCREISPGPAGMDRVTGFAAADIQLPAVTLVRYRLSTLGIIRHTEKEARSLILSE